MGRKLRLVFDEPAVAPMGHNSLSADFIYPRGVQAPHVTAREYGSRIPGSYPGDIQTYHTHAQDGEWLNYLNTYDKDGRQIGGPNACKYPPKQAELTPRLPIELVQQRADEIAEQYSRAIAMYCDRTEGARRISYNEVQRYISSKEVLLSELIDPPQPVVKRRLVLID